MARPRHIGSMDELRPPLQRIQRLTPLAEVLARIDSMVGPVAPRDLPNAEGLGRILANDLRVGPHPEQALAPRDGFAVRSEETSDAGSYAPAPLSLAVRVEVGDRLPHGADAVTALDAIDEGAHPPHALATVAPGEGVLAAGHDVVPSVPLLRAGQPLRSADLAVLIALGITRVSIRLPTVRLI